jgi:hypothetical protein
MVEIKTPAGELSDPQQSVMATVLASGGWVGVVRDAAEMLGLLDAWGIPRATPGIRMCDGKGAVSKRQPSATTTVNSTGSIMAPTYSSRLVGSR